MTFESHNETWVHVNILETFACKMSAILYCSACVNASTPSAIYMRQWTIPALVHVKGCRLLLPEPMLTYCELNLTNKLQRNLNRTIKPFIHGTAFEITVCEMTDIWLKGEWVNPSLSANRNMPICQMHENKATRQICVVVLVFYRISRNPKAAKNWFSTLRKLVVNWEAVRFCNNQPYIG